MRKTSEESLLLYLKENYYPDLEYNTDGEVLIEVKCRNKHYPTIMIERKTYDSLIEEARGRNLIPLYINSTPEGIYVWDLFSVDVDFLPENVKYDKEVGYLDTEDAEVLF
jgi:hypothetical protein